MNEYIDLIKCFYYCFFKILKKYLFSLYRFYNIKENKNINNYLNNNMLEYVKQYFQLNVKKIPKLNYIQLLKDMNIQLILNYLVFY